VKRVEAFIKAQNGLKIKTLSGEDIDRYFEMTGRVNRLSYWQFRRCIDAMRTLYRGLPVIPAAREVDWRYRLDPTGVLDADKPASSMPPGTT